MILLIFINIHYNRPSNYSFDENFYTFDLIKLL